MNYLNPSSSKPRLQKIAEVSLSVYSVPSKSQSKEKGAMMEKLPSPTESEVERISRNWDIGRRVCSW
jgi:hypothetical protein